MRIGSGKRPESTQVRRKLTALRHRLLRVNVSPRHGWIYATTPIFWLLIFPVSRKLTKLVGHLAAFIIVIFFASSIIAIAMAQDDVKSFFWIFFGVFLPWIIAFSIFNIGYGKISNNVARVSE
ncbi:hypothetical protein [Rugamonas sp. DEMB1]|uniref:hypothetical protein n=1 Tax=Rugamonas sp. DEMB1 TaxID=3039386 RepID=UPI00244A5DAF|nr:hypothetical protein [Rugamonas sp. DEMB1]WGG49952.1 hypothetical protein QC826_26330 [Rugamonas sp. DEMB1]